MGEDLSIEKFLVSGSISGGGGEGGDGLDEEA